MPADAPLKPVAAVCVYAASSDAIAPAYHAAADALGTALAEAGLTLVYGGGSIGLMGTVCRAVHAGDGRIVGVIPERLRRAEICYEDADELLVTPSMGERKRIMAERADAFIAMPGGFGTLEELAEVLVLRQLHYHDKPIVLLNVNGFWTPLIELFEHFYAQRFARPENRALYRVAETPAEALLLARDNRPSEAPEKWW